MAIVKDFKVDALRVRVFSSRNEMGQCAGLEAAKAINDVIAKKGFANVMFAAAPSQNETLATLCAQNVDWSKVNAFHMDEYVGLDPKHPAGFRNFLKAAIFDKFAFKSVNLINGNASNLEDELARYTDLLKKYPLDVCLCGVGENGHIAFNDPSVADFKDSALIKIVKLEEKCRMQQVHYGCFNDISEVPTHAFTVTIPGMTSSDCMLCTVPAITKAEASKHMLNDEVSEACPATILRQHKDARLYLDPDSASLL